MGLSCGQCFCSHLTQLDDNYCRVPGDRRAQNWLNEAMGLRLRQKTFRPHITEERNICDLQSHEDQRRCQHSQPRTDRIITHQGYARMVSKPRNTVSAVGYHHSIVSTLPPAFPCGAPDRRIEILICDTLGTLYGKLVSE